MNCSKKQIKQEKMYMSSGKIARGYSVDAKWATEKWLSEPTTLEFIELWENLNNLDFNKSAFEEISSIALSIGSAPTICELKEKAHIKSMFVDKEFNEDIFLHKDLAIDFASWISPSFRTYCLLIAQENQSSQLFKSEEDYIVSPKTLAEFTKRNALKNYKSQVGSFVYNFTHVKCK